MSHAAIVSKSPLILVVEDEMLIRMMAVDALTDAGFEVLEAEHAADALVHLAGRSHDIVVLCTDVHMPGEMDGIGLVRHVFSIWPKIGLLLVSGKARPAVEDLPEGARFLAKPYEIDAFVAQIGEMAIH